MSFSLLDTDPWILDEEVNVPLIRFHLMRALPVRYQGPAIQWESLTSDLKWVGALPAEVVERLELVGSIRGGVNFDCVQTLDIHAGDGPQNFPFGVKIRTSSPGHSPLIIPLKATVTSDRILRLWEGEPLSLLQILEGNDLFHEGKPCRLVPQTSLEEHAKTYTLEDLNLQIISD